MSEEVSEAQFGHKNRKYVSNNLTIYFRNVLGRISLRPGAALSLSPINGDVLRELVS